MALVSVFGYSVSMNYFEGHGLIGLLFAIATCVCI